jgi:hypothetical protein
VAPPDSGLFGIRDKPDGVKLDEERCNEGGKLFDGRQCVDSTKIPAFPKSAGRALRALQQWFNTERRIETSKKEQPEKFQKWSETAAGKVLLARRNQTKQKLDQALQDVASANTEEKVMETEQAAEDLEEASKAVEDTLKEAKLID